MKTVMYLVSVILISILVWMVNRAVSAAQADGGASPATYYVDNAITDMHVASATPDFTIYNPVTFTTNTGTASVYKTMADVNALCPSPGDRVLFRKGQTWREQLTVPASGSKGSPITYGAHIPRLIYTIHP